MWRIAAALVHLSVLAEAASQGSCAVGTTSLQLVKEKGYDLTGQTHVITGGDSGIGLGIASALLEAKARVVFLAHDVKKTYSLVRSIASRTGNSNFRIIPANLLSLNSTKNAADALMDEPQINVFIGDAGGNMMESFVTSDGFEGEFQMEYLSHFYLVQRLLPKLRESHGRIVLIGSSYISPYDKAGLCLMSTMPQGCEAIDRIAARAKRAVPPFPFVHFNGNSFLGIYLRVMLARQVALSETNVTAFSTHPGWVATPSMTGGYDDRVEESTGMTAATICQNAPWWVCLSHNADGTETTKTCPISSLEGSVGATYLAAADTSELADVNGAMTVLCGVLPKDLTFDPYLAMVDRTGETATRDYLKALYDRSQQWIDEAGYGSSQTNLVEIVSDTADIGSHALIPTPIGIWLVAFLCVMVLVSHSRRGTAHEGAREALLDAGEMRA